MPAPRPTRHDYGSFDIAVSLTPQGLTQYPRVLSLVFAAIDQLRRQGVPAHVFAERRTMAALDERYRDKGEGAIAGRRRWPMR